MENSSSRESQAVHLELKSPRKTAIIPKLEAILRRLLDIVIALAGLILLSPTFVLIALAIKHDSPGPVFYRGRRAGRGGKEFGILKFRTMYENESSRNGAKVTAQDDSRITPIGKWLRETKANELPQLWNVLVGEMSLVGPRPEDPEIVESWSEEDRQILLSVRPGITSPATVIYRDEESLLSSANVMQDYLKDILPTKLRLDTLYVRNRSLTTDLDVIFWTAIALLPKMRKMAIPQQSLYWGPISRLSGRYVYWFILDTIIAFIAVAISGVIWRLSRPLDIGLGRAFLYALTMSLLFSLMNRVFGLHKVEWSRAPASEAITLGVSIAVATLVVLFADAQIPSIMLLPDTVVLMAGVISLFGFVSFRYRERLITGAGTRWLNLRGGVRGIGENVMIVGAGENGALASWLFGRSDFAQAVKVVGLVDDDPRKQGLRIDGYDVLGMTSSIPDLAQKHDIGLIFYTINNIHPQQRARILSLCQKTGAKVVVLPDILNMLKTEMKIIPNPANIEGSVSPAGEVDELLAEVQSLLKENKVEVAQERLAAYRQNGYVENR